MAMAPHERAAAAVPLHMNAEIEPAAEAEAGAEARAEVLGIFLCDICGDGFDSNRFNASK